MINDIYVTSKIFALFFCRKGVPFFHSQTIYKVKGGHKDERSQPNDSTLHRNQT